MNTLTLAYTRPYEILLYLGNGNADMGAYVFAALLLISLLSLAGLTKKILQG